MRVQVDEGVALECDLWAGGAGVPFLLVHGLSSNRRLWDGSAARLQELGHPVATVDLRGHGRSDKPDDGYDFATMGADLLKVLDAVGFERAVLVGQSTGGNIVVDLADRAPERVAGVAGIDGGALELVRQFPEWERCKVALAPSAAGRDAGGADRGLHAPGASRRGRTGRSRPAWPTSSTGPTARSGRG